MLSELLQDVTLYEQVLVNIKLKPELNWRTHEAFQKACLEIQDELSDKGRLLIRPSGTEPVLRIMVEAQDLVTAQSKVNQLAQLLN